MVRIFALTYLAAITIATGSGLGQHAVDVSQTDRQAVEFRPDFVFDLAGDDIAHRDRTPSTLRR